MKRYLTLSVLISTTALISLSATTYVMMSDSALTDQAELIVVGRVLNRQTGFSDRCVTRYQVLVERILTGQSSADQIEVDVLGGENRDGEVLFLPGSPQLSNQGRTILFLVAGRDGAYNILHLMLGAFHESRSGTQSLAVRDLSEATEVSMPSITGARASGSLKKPRDFEAFAEWLADRGRGVLRNGDYVLESVESSAFAQPFGLNPPPFRYFDFDEGGSVDWFFPASGQPGLAGGGVTEFQEALDAWNSEPVSNVNLELEGTTDSTAGFTVDGINNITVGDPNSEIPGTFTCGQGGGGVAGLGGGGMSAGTGIYRGQTYFQFGEVNIVIQDGVECLFSQANGRSSAAELYAHELGHTLGLGHSCGQFRLCTPGSIQNEALMRAISRGEVRGARLGADDIRGIRFLYTPLGGAGIANLTFPQSINGGDNNSRFILRNNGTQRDDGQIRFFGQSGNPRQVPIGGIQRSSLNYSIPPFGALDVSTDGTGALAVGPVGVVSDLGADSVIEGTEAFILFGNQVSVPDAPPRALHQVFTSVTNSENTGVAFFNPDRNMGATVCVFLLDNSGSQVASTEVTLGPGEQTAVFATESKLFQSFFTAAVVNAGFTGSINIQVKDGKVVSVLGLLQDKATGALTAVDTSPNGFVP